MDNRIQMFLSSYSFFILASTTILPLPSPSAAPPSRVYVAFVFMTTSVIRRPCKVVGVNTAEGNYSDCCCCLLPAWLQAHLHAGSFCCSS